MYKKPLQTQPIIHSIKERKAVSNLLARPEHLSTRVVEQVENLEYRRDGYYSPPTGSTGTADPITRQSYFQWMNAVYVNPKRLDLRNEPISINIYAHHLPQGIICFSGYNVISGYDGYHVGNSSIAKVLIRLESETDSSPSEVSLLSINGRGEHRLGSIFVQLAIEYSIKNGCDGRVTLRSVRESGQFYFKLGFVPDCDAVYDELLAGQQTNGGDMYLPEAAIAIWKEKINKNPLLIRQVGRQMVETMWLHSKETTELWPFLIDKLHFNAIRELNFDYASYYTQGPLAPAENLIYAFKSNTSLEWVTLKGTSLNWSLSEMIDALSSHRNLSRLTIRNYDESVREMDEAAFQALARLITHIPRLERLSLAYLTILSNSFVIFCEALTSTSLVKEINFYHTTLSLDNVQALRKALLSNVTITEINSSQCNNHLEVMLVEVRKQRNSALVVSEIPQTLFARKPPLPLQAAISISPEAAP